MHKFHDPAIGRLAEIAAAVGATMAAPQGGAPAGGGAPAAQANPFLSATYPYSEVVNTQTYTPGSSTQSSGTINITPGGYLRGLLMQVSATGGSLGSTGSLTGDMPWATINSVTIESIDGTPFLYPMNGYSYYLVSRFCRPWDGDPAADPSYSNSANPAFRMRFFLEARNTIGVVPNTDARAQYRMRYDVAASATMFTSLPAITGSNPAVTVELDLETYAQPDANDLNGVPNQQMPDGLALQRFLSHQSGIALNTGTTTVQTARVGNLIRTLILVVRNSSGVRTDLTSDPIRFRLDNTQLLVENRTHRDYENDRFYTPDGSIPTWSSRPTGVYVYPRFHKPGSRQGFNWLATQAQSYLAWELNGGPSSGTLEIITEDLAIAGNVPGYLVGL